jgi:hypothetical protein
MAKTPKSNPLITLLPLLLLAGTAGAAFYLYKYRPTQFSSIVSDAKGKVKGATTDLNIDASALVDQAQKKLVEPQPIINDNGETQEETQTANTIENTLKTETQKIINQAIEQAKGQAQAIPKKEAARITRDVCNQIVTELERE